MTNSSAPSREAKMAVVEQIMREDRDVLRALASGGADGAVGASDENFEKQMAVARELMSRHKNALRKLAE